ncbi:MAG: tRNA-dihydrouridine synthase family protein [Coriobacteriia bacterium]|nr:tRNA-dihydrouridine synthase family protein [Coriobacteriia bacterium]
MNKQELFEYFETPRVLMAPMAGVSDKVYRSIMLEHGADLAYTEMVSATGLIYGSKATLELLDPYKTEDKLAVQLFGREPHVMAQAASMVQEYLGEKLELIDINMGCPVTKVVKKGEGSALLLDPDRAQQIVLAMSNEVSVAISAKIRSAYTKDNPVFLEVAQALEAAGIAALGFHGRSRGQGYRGLANRAYLDELVKQSTVPIIASGDVMSASDSLDYLSRGAKAVFVARGSYGNPWIFKQTKEALQGRQLEKPSLYERIACARVHMRRAQEEGLNPGRMRKISAWYLKGMPEANMWRSKSMKAVSFEDFEGIYKELEAKLEVYARWN